MSGVSEIQLQTLFDYQFVHRCTQLHRITYDETSFTTRFSDSMLFDYYMLMLESAAVVFAVHRDDKIGALLIGSTRRMDFLGTFYRRNFLSVILTALRAPKFYLKFACRLVVKLIPTSGDRNQVVAMSESARLWNIAVSPELQGSNIAEGLVQNLIDWSKSKGFATIGLSVQLQNARARRFYERVGFSASSQSNGVLEMTLRLSDFDREKQGRAL